MKIPFLIIALFFLITGLLSAQSSAIDSLEQLLKHKKTSDENYLDILHALGSQYIKEGHDKTQMVTDQLIELAGQYKDSTMLIEAYILQGNIQRKKGEWVKASNAFRLALKISELTNNKKGLVQCYFKIASMHYETTDLERAFDYANLALKTCEDNNLQELYPQAYNLLGGLFFYKAVSDSIPENSKLAYQKAEEYYNKTIAIAGEKEDEEQVATTLSNLVSLKTNQGHHEIALQYGIQALDMNTRLNNKEGIITTFINIGNIYSELKDYDNAISFFKNALDLSLKEGFSKYQSYAVGNLMKAFRNQGNFEEAFQYSWDYIINTEAVYNKQKTEAIATLEAQYEVDKKEQANAILGKENELVKTRNTLMNIAVGGLALILFTLAFFFFKIRKQNQIIKSQNEQLKALNNTQTKLMAIIGHDLRGPLFNLQGIEDQFNYLLETGQADRLKELGGKMEKTAKYLTETLNNLLNWSMHNMGTFPYEPEEVYLRKTTENIFGLFESTADAKGIDLQMEVPGSSFAYVDKNAINTILRNMISNAIKFTDKGGQVEVSAASENGMVKLKVSDTGIGMSEAQMEKLLNGMSFERKKGTRGERSTGLGLILVKDLVKQNKGEVKVKSKEGIGTSFVISLPIK